MKRILLFTLVFTSLLFFSRVDAQEIPKKELRATWLTTVWGLDWPSIKISKTGNVNQINRQKNDLKTILDGVKRAGLNAVFFQVRSECDAMYESSYEPWSAHLVTSRGLDPGYDPLKFAIEEAHKRGLELHAWINPYRFESALNKYAGQPGDYSQTNPDWVLDYSKNSILDPGNPEVRKRISDIITEIVQKYDVDGIIFDDYFYAYGGTPYSLDSYSQSKWKPANQNIHDWRRENVNKMVRDVNNAIKSQKPWVRFGLSPFGIWTTDDKVAESYGLTLPKGISGLDAYKSIYCDPVAWLKEKTVDYVSPQVYWSTTSTRQNYGKLVNWWSDVVHIFGRHLYVSQSLSNLDESNYTKSAKVLFDEDFDFSQLEGLSLIEYSAKMGLEKSALGYDPSEYGKQIDFNRLYDKNNAPGSVFFRTLNLFKKGFINYLTTHQYKNKALPPAFNWDGFQNEGIATNLKVENNTFSWEYDSDNLRYAVYAIPNDKINETGNFKTGKYLLGMSYSKSYNLEDYIHLLGDHTFAVSVLNRYGNEFAPVLQGVESPQNQAATLIKPINNQSVYPDYEMTWGAVNNAENYIIEISPSDSFDSIIVRKEVDDTNFDLSTIKIDVDKSYYWRVFTRMVGANDESSEIQTFKVKSYPKPSIINPTNNQDNVDVTTTISWQNYEEGDYKYKVQISDNDKFNNVIYEKNNLENTECPIEIGTLETFSAYYVRVLSFNDTITTAWSDIVKFYTVELEPSIPQIVAPVENEQISLKDIVIKVKQDKLAKSFTYQWAPSASFPWNKRKKKTVASPDTTLTLSDLKKGAWYIKVRANYDKNKHTDWSQVVMFENVYTGINSIDAKNFSLNAWFADNDYLYVNYSVPNNANISLFLIDVLGRKVKVLQNNQQSVENKTKRFMVNDLPRGIYILNLRSNISNQSIKIIKK